MVLSAEFIVIVYRKSFIERYNLPMKTSKDIIDIYMCGSDIGDKMKIDLQSGIVLFLHMPMVCSLSPYENQLQYI